MSSTRNDSRQLAYTCAGSYTPRPETIGSLHPFAFAPGVLGRDNAGRQELAKVASVLAFPEIDAVIVTGTQFRPGSNLVAHAQVIVPATPGWLDLNWAIDKGGVRGIQLYPPVAPTIDTFFDAAKKADKVDTFVKAGSVYLAAGPSEYVRLDLFPVTDARFASVRQFAWHGRSRSSVAFLDHELTAGKWGLRFSRIGEPLSPAPETHGSFTFDPQGIATNESQLIGNALTKLDVPGIIIRGDAPQQFAGVAAFGWVVVPQSSIPRLRQGATVFSTLFERYTDADFARGAAAVHRTGGFASSMFGGLFLGDRSEERVKLGLLVASDERFREMTAASHALYGSETIWSADRAALAAALPDHAGRDGGRETLRLPAL